MAVRSYNPSEVSVIVAGRIIGGFADGTFVGVERNNDSWALSVGADGEGTRSKSTDRSGRFTITLNQSSESNEFLTELEAADDISGTGTFPVLVKDGSGTSIHEGETCWIVKPASAPYGKESDNREWIIETDLLRTLVGKN